ncbi:MAG: hypothetical protein NC094_11940 [Bacteroidales bacterium]|nr:hypothetical protein [Lachnoclostridium sp.]MCM1385294.1 hypothetical protein [Lachnoclostridium sp.]MCM1466120.1 hypothetical protein [Bacteroidales bacterium]
MNIFNKNKVVELERKIEELESELETYRKKESEKNSGKHKTGAWCEGCKNLVTNTAYSMYGCYPAKFCMLDNECKDRKE